TATPGTDGGTGTGADDGLVLEDTGGTVAAASGFGLGAGVGLLTGGLPDVVVVTAATECSVPGAGALRCGGALGRWGDRCFATTRGEQQDGGQRDQTDPGGNPGPGPGAGRSGRGGAERRRERLSCDRGNVHTRTRAGTRPVGDDEFQGMIAQAD